MSSKLKRTVINCFSWYGFSLSLNFVLRWICLYFLWHAIGVGSQRSYALLQVVVGLVLIVVDLGVENGVVRFFAREPRFLRVAARTFARNSLFLFLPMAMAISIWWYGKYHSCAAVGACAAGYGFALFRISGAVYRSTNRARSFVLWDSLRNVLITVGVVLAALVLDNLSVLVWFSVHGVVSIAVGLALLCHVWGGAADTVPAVERESSYWSYLLPVFGVNLVLWLETFVDTAFLNHYHPGELPLFRLVLDYCQFFAALTLVVNRAWPAIYFRFAEDGPPGLFMGRQIVAVHTGAALLAFAAFLAAPVALKLWTGCPLRADALGVTALIIAANAIGILVVFLRPGLELARKTGRLLRVFIVAIAAAVVGNALLVPPLGLYGAAVTSVGVMLIAFWGTFLLTEELRGNRGALIVCAGQQVIAALGMTVAVGVMRSVIG